MGEIEGEGWAEIEINDLEEDEYKNLLLAVIRGYGTVTITTNVGMDLERDYD